MQLRFSLKEKIEKLWHSQSQSFHDCVTRTVNVTLYPMDVLRSTHMIGIRRLRFPAQFSPLVSYQLAPIKFLVIVRNNRDIRSTKVTGIAWKRELISACLFALPTCNAGSIRQLSEVILLEYGLLQ